MVNSYIVDTFLSAAMWVILTFLYFDIQDRIKEINEVMSHNLIALAIENTLKMAAYISLPLVAIWAFLCWRFMALMVISKTFGIGGIGLLVILGLSGVIMLGLTVLLVCIKHSGLVDAAMVGRQARQAIASQQKY